jgi:hypothetical protein
MYTYHTQAYGPATGLRAMTGIGNYVFSGLGAVDVAAPVVVETPPDTSQIVDTTTTPAANGVPLPTDITPVLTDAEIDQKQFGYFGSMSAAVGMQAMSISGGVALATIGFFLGLKVANATRVSTKEIIAASAVAAASAFLGILAIKTFR